MSSIIHEHKICPRCKHEWDRVFLSLFDRRYDMKLFHLNDLIYLRGAGENCPKCRRDRPWTNRSVTEISDGCVVVWDERAE